MTRQVFLLIYLFIITAGYAQQYDHGFKKLKNPQIDSSHWFRSVTNDIQKSKSSVNLNGLGEAYFNRYDYLINSLPDVKYHPSTVVKGDTIGLSLKNEYIDFYPQICADSIIPAAYLKQRFVSNEDWNYFQKYIVDSLARRRMLEEHLETYGIPKIHFSSGLSEPEYADSGLPEYWAINWDKKVKCAYDPTNPFLRDFVYLYYAEHEQYHRKPEINTRRLMFLHYWLHNTNDKGSIQYDRRPYKTYVDSFFNHGWPSSRHSEIIYDSLVKEIVCAFDDSTLWKLQENHPHYGDLGDQLVRFYAWHPQFKNDPVTGINAYQAKGYLAWMQREHQQFLDRKKAPYMVEYTLPTPLELKGNELDFEIGIRDFDLSAHRITNKDYSEFIKYVRDSIGLRILAEQFDEKKYLIPSYDYENHKKSPEDWVLNWSKRKDVYSKDTLIREQLKDFEYPEHLGGKALDWDMRKLNFSYYYWNFELAAPLGELKESRYSTPTGYKSCEYRKYLETPFKENAKRYQEMGKDLNLGNENKLCRNNSVRAHHDRSRFIIYERISIYPQMKCMYNYFCQENDWDEKGRKDCCTEFFEGKRVPEYDFKSEPKASMTNISFEQAHAFYCWKQRTDGYIVKHDNVLIANYIPSEEEWLMIQNGEKVIHSSRRFQMPTPAFRYTLKFYPRHK